MDRCRGHRRKAMRCAAAIGLAIVGAGVADARTPPLPDSVIEAMNEALADERRALATYEVILDRFGDVRPFVNIARAEQWHIDMLLPLYERYGVTPPADDTAVAESVYTEDMLGLCQIGVQAEIDNVRLYDERLLPAVAAYPDISAVMQRLRDASQENHLPAFQRCVARGGQPGRGPGGGFGRQGRFR